MSISGVCNFVAEIFFLNIITIMITRVPIPKIHSRSDWSILRRTHPPTIDPRRPNIAQKIPIFLSTFPARAKL